MKVSVNNHNKPAPIAGALIGGLLSAFGGIGKTLSEQSFQADQSERQMEHDIAMSNMNQKHIKEQMSISNQYQIEQWERENEYNNPSAVLARYRQAGISPYAALGSVSGAGIAGGLSSAPSGSSTGSASQIRGHISFPDVAGLMQVSSQAFVNEAQVKLLESEAKLNAEKAEMESLRVSREQFLQENGDLFNELNKRGWEADVKQVEAYKAQIDKTWYRFEKQQAFEISQSQLDNLGLALEQYRANINKLVAEKKLTEQQASNLLAENAIIVERYNTQKAVTDKERALVDVAKSQEGVYSAEADKLIAQVAQEWAKIGIEGAEVVVRVVEMLMPFIPRNSKSKQKLTQSVERTVMRNAKGKVTSTIEKTKNVIAD